MDTLSKDSLAVWQQRISGALVDAAVVPVPATDDLDGVVAAIAELAAMATPKSGGSAASEKQDAMRWRWWRANHMRVMRDEPGDWTCWVEIPCIPFRSRTQDPDELTDALIARFPLNGRPPPTDVNERRD